MNTKQEAKALNLGVWAIALFVLFMVVNAASATLRTSLDVEKHPDVVQHEGN